MISFRCFLKLNIISWTILQISFVISVFVAYLHLKGQLTGNLTDLFLPEDRKVLNPRNVFEKLDQNNDDYLSFSEFVWYEKYYKLLLKEDVNEDSMGIVELPVVAKDNVVTVESFFEPLNLNSLSKDLKDVPENSANSLHGLLHWNQTFREEQNFSSAHFTMFLPPDDEHQVPGITWWVIEPQLDKYVGQLPSSRHFPPFVGDKFRPLYALLQMFHPRPFLWTRFAPQGTVAVLRAADENSFDIVLRVHAEYQLNEPPLFPFWFTPAQFIGRLIISKNGSLVRHFHLEVPVHRKLNVDMEWLNGLSEESMEVDIGYVPRMKLASKTSQPLEDVVHEMSEHDAFREIALEDAVDAVEQTFYPFKQVKYHNLTEAFRIAEQESKLVHGILLWGALDDQSC